MQRELQFTLSIIGILIIGGVLLHGLWTIRKNGKKQKKARLESRNWDPGFEQEDAISGEAPIYDDIGIGKARVVINKVSDNVETENTTEASIDVHEDPIKISAVDDIPTVEDISSDTSIDFAPISETSTDNIIQADEIVPVEDLDQANDFAHLDALAPIDEFDLNAEAEQVAQYQDDNETQKVAQYQDENEAQKVEGIFRHDIADDKTLDLGASQVSDLSADSLEPAAVDIGPASEEQKPSISAPVEEAKNESESAVYSNVVTQPKPEFSRPIHTSTNLDNSFGQPPEFLLRKTDNEIAAETQNADAENNPPFTVETPIVDEPNATVPADEPSVPRSDFSLNIQEGPEVKTNVEGDAQTSDVEKDLSFTEQAKRFVRRNKKTVGEKIRKDPVLKDKTAEDQMRIDFDETQEAKVQEAATKVSPPEVETSSSSTKDEVGETDVLVLNIRSTDESPIQGASLLPMLLTLGFKFGEHDIFHRHVNTNGKGPILFSLTNMFKPGVFDIDNIENFSTYGLSLFMMLPIEGDAQQVFNMMHNAARKLSEEFGCRILDGNKVGVSKQSMQQYVERIREFERKRINK